MKKLLATLLASTMALTTIGGLVACGDGAGSGKKLTEVKPDQFSSITNLDDPLSHKDGNSTDKVAACELTVWAPAEMIPMYTDMVTEFTTTYYDGKYSAVEISFQEMEEGNVQTTMSNDPAGAADVFFFTGGQAGTMINNDWLLPLRGATGSFYSAAIMNRDLSGSVATVSRNGYAYAFPVTADDGYMMAYSTDDLTPDEIGSLDKILEKATEKDKSFMYRYGTGFYGGTFFFGAGALPVMNNADSDFSKFNSPEAEIGAKAMIKYINSGYTKNGTTKKVLDLGDNDATLKGILNGTIIAGVCGIWEIGQYKGNESKIGFAKLPKYTLDDKEYQMGAMFGGKYCGVNARTKNGQVAMALANFLSNEKAQAKRFELHKSGPSNAKLSNSAEVKANPALAALGEQVGACAVNNADVPQTYWDGLQTYVADIVEGKITNDNLGLADLVALMTPEQA